MKSPDGAVKKGTFILLKKIQMIRSVIKPALLLLNFQQIRNVVIPMIKITENGILKLSWLNPKITEIEIIKNMKAVRLKLILPEN
jgi:hypothetical protein